jgi:hypothetical protein
MQVRKSFTNTLGLVPVQLSFTRTGKYFLGSCGDQIWKTLYTPRFPDPSLRQSNMGSHVDLIRELVGFAIRRWICLGRG